MSNKITITISGPTLSGKTTLKHFIAEKLAEVGIVANMVDAEEAPGVNKASQIVHHAGELAVDLVEEQLGRRPTTDARW